MLSHRMSESYLGDPDFLMGNFATASNDPFDPESNPRGYVNLGTAVNALSESEIQNWLQKDGIFEHQRSWQHYYQLRLIYKDSQFYRSTILHRLIVKLLFIES